MARTRGGTPRSPQGPARSQRATARAASTPQRGTTQGTSTPQRGTTQGASTPQRGTTQGASTPQRGTTQGASTPQRGTTQGATTPQRGASTAQRGTRRGGSTSQRGTRRGGSTSQRGTRRGGSTSQRANPRGGSTSQQASTRGGSTSQRGTNRRRINAARAGPNVPPSSYRPIDFEERYRELHQIRYSEFISLVCQLTDEQKNQLISEWAQRDVSLAFDIYDRVNKNYPPVPPPDNDDPLRWCTCEHCEPMPKADENVCCGMKPENCLSRKAVVEIMILDPAVLGLAEVQFNEFLGEDPRHDNAARRHAAYRQYTFWRHGRLGAGIRRPVPSCVVLRIRREYPSPDGTYKGYLPSRTA